MKLKLAAVLLGLSVAAPTYAQTVPQGYPAEYAEIVKAGEAEGGLSVYSNTDVNEVGDLIAAFNKLYPNIKVDYLDTATATMYSRFISEVGAGTPSADVVWASNIDVVAKLAYDGWAEEYKSPELPNIPGWANWQNKVFSTTAEPIVFAYNTRLVPAEDVPTSHAALTKLLTEKTEQYKGKITAYDPELSLMGNMLIGQDLQIDPEATKALASAMGKADVKVYNSTGTMMEKLLSGEHTIAHNIFSSYLAQRQKTDPTVGIAIPTDYTIVTARGAMISNKAPHPNAAKLFVDFLMSKEGQTQLRARSMYPVRTDMAGDPESRLPGTEKLGGDVLKPIQINEALVKPLDPNTRVQFLKDWQAWLAAGK